MKGWRLFIGLIVIIGLVMIGLLTASMMIGSIRRADEISFIANAPTSEGWVTEQLHLLDVETGVKVKVGFWGDGGAWTPDGQSYHILFNASDQEGFHLMDAMRRSFGHTIKGLDGMVLFFSWSPDGKYLGVLLKSKGVNSIYLYDPQTEEIRNLTSGATLFASDFVWSPDSTKIAYVSSKFEVWVTTLEGGPRQLPLKLQYAGQPLLWTLDSEALIVKTTDDTITRTQIDVTDDSRTVIPVCDASPDLKHQSSLAWHPNGTLTCTRRNADTKVTDIVLVNIETGDFKVLASEQAVIGNLSWTSDGHYLLYQADAYIIAFNVMAYDEVNQSLSLVRRVEGRGAQWRVRQNQ